MADQFKEVSAFIDEEVYQSKAWDKSNEIMRKKAVKQSERTLKRFFPSAYKNGIPVDHLAEQTIWLMKVDDTFQRGELGATSITLDGMSISIKDKDRTLSPYILDVHRITPDSISGGISRRKVGRYSAHIKDSFRRGW